MGSRRAVLKCFQQPSKLTTWFTISTTTQCWANKKVCLQRTRSFKTSERQWARSQTFARTKLKWRGLSIDLISRTLMATIRWTQTSRDYSRSCLTYFQMQLSLLIVTERFFWLLRSKKTTFWEFQWLTTARESRLRIRISFSSFLAHSKTKGRWGQAE